MAYNTKRLNLSIEDEVDEIKQLTSYFTKCALGLVNEELIGDVEYNQRWWKGYCQENKLDVTTGKSLRGSSYLIPSNYTLF